MINIIIGVINLAIISINMVTNMVINMVTNMIIMMNDSPGLLDLIGLDPPWGDSLSSPASPPDANTPNVF